MSKVTQYGSWFVPGGSGIEYPELPVGVYDYHISPKDEQYLELVSENFEMPKKLYYTKKDKLFKSVVTNSWLKHPSDNLGIALLGEKGQGKTILAKDICNNLNIPVILITNKIPMHINVISWLHSFDQQLVVFIDEFEKLFEYYGNDDKENHSQETFLSLLNGVYTSKHGKFFIFTSNESLNDYLLNRPSRIKYVMNYKNGIDPVMGTEIIEDLVTDESLKKDLLQNLDFVSCNLDVLLQIISEVNTHMIPYSSFKDIFNFKPTTRRYIIELQDKGSGKVYASVIRELEVSLFNKIVESEDEQYITMRLPGLFPAKAGLTDRYTFNVNPNTHGGYDLSTDSCNWVIDRTIAKLEDNSEKASEKEKPEILETIEALERFKDPANVIRIVPEVTMTISSSTKPPVSLTV